MTDNRTTELRISEPLRGFIRHQSNRAYIDGGQARWLTEIADEIDAKHEQAIAATLGGGECEVVKSYGKHPVTNNDVVLYNCSKCGMWIGLSANYCGNCGARIRKKGRKLSYGIR